MQNEGNCLFVEHELFKGRRLTLGLGRGLGMFKDLFAGRGDVVAALLLVTASTDVEFARRRAALSSNESSSRGGETEGLASGRRGSSAGFSHKHSNEVREKNDT